MAKAKEKPATKKKCYRLIAGKHTDLEGVQHKPGARIWTHENLVKKFRGQFELVNTEPVVEPEEKVEDTTSPASDETTEEVADDTHDDADADEEGGGDEGESSELGVDVTSKFKKTIGKKKLRVYKKGDLYAVISSDDLSQKPLHSKPLESFKAVKEFIKTGL